MIRNQQVGSKNSLKQLETASPTLLMKRMKLSFLALVVALLTTSFAHAQLSSADILGTATDNTGAVIPNAKVTLTDKATNISRTAITNRSGDYVFNLLPVSTYKVKVEAPGFKASTIDGLSVEAGDRARADAHLPFGASSETVNVEAQTPLLQADNATVSSTVTAKSVQDLPLNGRNFVQVVQLVPGANSGPGNGPTSGGVPTIVASLPASRSTARTILRTLTLSMASTITKASSERLVFALRLKGFRRSRIRPTAIRLRLAVPPAASSTSLPALAQMISTGQRMSSSATIILTPINFSQHRAQEKPSVARTSTVPASVDRSSGIVPSFSATMKSPAHNQRLPLQQHGSDACAVQQYS